MTNINELLENYTYEELLKILELVKLIKAGTAMPEVCQGSEAE